MLKENIAGWAIISEGGRIVPFDLPVEGSTFFAGIFVKEKDAERWLKKIQGQTGFKGSVEKVIIIDALEESIC